MGGWHTCRSHEGCSHTPLTFVPVTSTEVWFEVKVTCNFQEPVCLNLAHLGVLIAQGWRGALKGSFSFSFTSFSGHRVAQRECAQRGSGPMRGAIPTQSHNPERLAAPPGSTPPTLFKQSCRFFCVPQDQISASAVRWDLRCFTLIRED